MLDVLLFDLVARSDLRKPVSGNFGEDSKAHTERLPWYFFFQSFRKNQKESERKDDILNGK